MLLVASLATLLYKFSFFIENDLSPEKTLFFKNVNTFSGDPRRQLSGGFE